MPEQRVSDEQLAKHLGGAYALLNPPGDTVSRDLALDLRDCRALLAAVAPVVKAAVKVWEGRNAGVSRLGMLGREEHLVEAVDALTDDVRKEFGG